MRYKYTRNRDTGLVNAVAILDESGSANGGFLLLGDPIAVRNDWLAWVEAGGITEPAEDA